MQLTSLLTVLLLAITQFSPFKTNSQKLDSTSLKLSDFAGTWVGHTSTGEFKLVLEERKNYPLPTGQTYDVIVGRHSYQVQGATSKNESLSKSTDKFILIGGFDRKHTGQLFVVFTDEVNHKVFHVKLAFTDEHKTKLLWQVIEATETVTINSQNTPSPGVSVPSSIALKKAQ